MEMGRGFALADGIGRGRGTAVVDGEAAAERMGRSNSNPLSSGTCPSTVATGPA